MAAPMLVSPLVPTSIGSYIMPRKLPPPPVPPAMGPFNPIAPTPPTRTQTPASTATKPVLTPPAAPGGTPAAGPGPGAGAAPGLTLQQQAELLAGLSINPQEAAINRAILAKQQLMQAQGMAGAGVLAALQKFGAGIPGAIQGAYEKAGADVSGYAGGVTGAVGDAAQAAAADAASRLASLGAPGTVTSQSPDAMAVANYTGGYLPASDLAAEAASRLAEASQVGYAGGVGIAQQSLQDMGATRNEISTLQAQGLDLENTRPAEIQKQLLTLRDEQRQQDALDAQLEQAKWERAQATSKAAADAAQAKFDNAMAIKKQRLNEYAASVTAKNLDIAQQRATSSDLFNYSKMTNTIWAVDKQGRYYDTKVPAPGSPGAIAAAKNRASIQAANIRARAAANQLAEKQAHDRVMEGIQQSKVGISQQQADTAAKREAAYEKYLKSKGKSGMTSTAVDKAGKNAASYARTYFYGQANPKFDPSKAAGAKNPKYLIPPGSAADALRAMLGRQVPYTIAYEAIRQFAKLTNSRWTDALLWQPNYRKNQTPSIRQRGPLAGPVGG